MPLLNRIILPTAMLFLLVGVSQVRAAGSATEDVRGTVDQVLQVLKQKELASDQRRSRLRELISARFDFEVMSQSTLGRQWKKASPEEQKKFIELYSKLLEETYVGKIESYTDEKVGFGEEKVKGDKALVETRIQTKSAEIPIDYKLVERPQGWLVYDVVIEGVSLIRNFRSSYGEIVDREGFPGLFKRMEEKIQQLEN